MSERRAYRTSEGEIWLWGAREAFEGSKPIGLVILGAFNAEKSALMDIQASVPDLAVLIGRLPGNHAPEPRVHSIEAYAAAFTQVLTELRRPAIVIGASIGGLVAFGLRAPNLKGILALDPPLRTGKLWPLREGFRQRLRNDPTNERLAEFIFNVFGISPDAHEDRNYDSLLEGLTAPTWVMYGDDALLPERPISRDPSLLDEPERNLLRRHPGISTALVEGVGHNLPAYAFNRIVGRLEVLMTSVGLRPPSCGK